MAENGSKAESLSASFLFTEWQKEIDKIEEDAKSREAIRAGSSPASGTKNCLERDGFLILETKMRGKRGEKRP